MTEWQPTTVLVALSYCRDSAHLWPLVTSFKVIQAHLFQYQSPAHFLLTISEWYRNRTENGSLVLSLQWNKPAIILTYLHPISHRSPVSMQYWPSRCLQVVAPYNAKLACKNSQSKDMVPHVQYDSSHIQLC